MARKGLDVLEQVRTSITFDPEHTAFCDAHDLIAAITLDQDSDTAVTVYRLKGEIAFTIALRYDEELRPLCLRWKRDGSLLAVTWSDEECCLYSGENGKLLYELPTKQSRAGDDADWSLDLDRLEQRGNALGEDAQAPEGDAKSAPIMWTSYDSSAREPSSDQQSTDHLTTEDGVSGVSTNGSHTTPQHPDSGMFELVNSIATLDTTCVLPRLSKIEPAVGLRSSTEASKFSAQASTDTIFDASAFAPGIFSTLLTSDRKGCVTVFVDEIIKLGRLQLPSPEQIQTASHPQCSFQAILTRGPSNPTAHTLNLIDLPLDRLGSPLNYIISLNTRRLQSLTAYITHTLRCMHQEIQTGIKGVPSRLLNLLAEDLRPHNTSPTLELQHLALTTNFHPVMLEWLKDIVKETGHKRWDQAVNGMYTHIQAYLFKHLLPALQRLVAATSALRGQVRFHAHIDTFTISLAPLEALLERAEALALVAQKALQVVGAEHAQFRAFSRWLRVMVDVAVAGPETRNAEEIEEREAPNVDTELCLRYIGGPLMESRLKGVCEAAAGLGAMRREEFFGHEVVKGTEREGTVKALVMLQESHVPLEPREKGDEGAHPTDHVNLPLLACLLKAHTRVVIEEINTWQSQAVPKVPDSVSLTHAPEDGAMGKVFDMAITPSSSRDDREKGRNVVQILASSGEDQDELVLLRVARTAVKARGKTSQAAPEIERVTLSLPHSSAGRTIIHAAFASPCEALALVNTSAQPESEPRHHLIALPLPSSPSSSQQQPRILHAWPTSHPTSSSITAPTHFTLGNRPGHRIAVVFSCPSGSRGTSWEVLDLEHILDEQDEEADVEMA